MTSNKVGELCNVWTHLIVEQNSNKLFEIESNPWWISEKMVEVRSGGECEWE